MRVGRVTSSLRRGIGCTIVLLPCSRTRKNIEIIEYPSPMHRRKIIAHRRHWTIKPSVSLSLSSFYRSFARDRAYLRSSVDLLAGRNAVKIRFDGRMQLRVRKRYRWRLR